MESELDKLLHEIGTLAEKHTKNGWRFTRAGRRNPVIHWRLDGGTWRLDVDGEVADGPAFDIPEGPHEPEYNIWTPDVSALDAMTAARVAVATLRKLEDK